MAPRPTVPGVVWPGWGARLMESDVDYDIWGDIENQCGFEMYPYGPASGPDDGIGVTRCRIAFNAGLFTRLFDKYEACGNHYKKYGAKYYVVILVYLAMSVGATISSEQLDYVRSIYKSAGLFKEGVQQMGEALRNYKPGVIYDFGSKGLYDTMNSKTGGLTNHIAPRYFQDGVPTSPVQLYIIDMTRPVTCDYCGEPDTEQKTLLRCGKCKEERYCDKTCQSSDWRVHKKYCYSPAQQKRRNERSNGGSSYTYDLSGNLKKAAGPEANDYDAAKAQKAAKSASSSGKSWPISNGCRQIVH